MLKDEPGIIRKLKINIVKKFISRFMPFPFDAGHREYSVLASLSDDNAHPSEQIINTSIRAAEEALRIQLDDIIKRSAPVPVQPNPNEWPGEHYRLLAAFVKLLKPKTVIEIGTERGIGTLALKHFLPEECKIVTFDVIPWHCLEQTLLTQNDFENGQLKQFTDDLSTANGYEKHRKLFETAELIFVDAKKDGIMEKKFIEHFNTTIFKNSLWVIFDDIKNWQMLKIWRDINHSKLDLTSFGHFTGTGVVLWTNK